MVPGRDPLWAIGVIVAAVTMLSTQNAGLHQRIDGLAAAVSDLRLDLEAIDDRPRTVEIAYGKVDQRLATIEGAVLPASSD